MKVVKLGVLAIAENNTYDVVKLIYQLEPYEVEFSIVLAIW